MRSCGGRSISPSTISSWQKELVWVYSAWQRYATTSDKKDHPIPATVPIYVLWAHATKFAYHGPKNRGSRAVDFFQVASKITTGAAVTTQQP